MLYVVGVALAPPGAFVAVKRLLPPSRHRDACAAICAVVVLNLLMAAYVVSAFREPDPEGDEKPAPRVGVWKERRERANCTVLLRSEARAILRGQRASPSRGSSRPRSRVDGAWAGSSSSAWSSASSASATRAGEFSPQAPS